MKTLIDLMERGLVPDALTRVGIRRLLEERLREQGAGGPEARLERRQGFVDELRSSPVAVHTDDANEQHYELPAAFFEDVLGPHLKYSSGWWPKGTDTLAEAEAAMLNLTCERAGIEDGMEVLDLGCGWGSLSLWVARHYPRCRVLAMSNSRSQAEFIRRRCLEFGLVNVEAVTADMNEFSTDRRFDRVVSVEMFEHMRNWAQLLARISTWLKPDGKMLMHVFCHREHAYPYVSAGPGDWIAEHFFTGGIMPSDSLPYFFQDDMKVERQWRVNGRHYSRTLEAWLEQMDRDRGRLMPLFKEVYGDHAGRWFRRWRVFFMACSELFVYRQGDEWWVSHYLLAPARLAAPAALPTDGLRAVAGSGG